MIPKLMQIKKAHHTKPIREIRQSQSVSQPILCIPASILRIPAETYHRPTVLQKILKYFPRPLTFIPGNATLASQLK